MYVMHVQSNSNERTTPIAFFPLWRKSP